MNEKKKPVTRPVNTLPTSSTKGKKAPPPPRQQKPPLPSDPTRIEYFKDIVATLRDPLLVLDKDLHVLAANRSFYKFFKVRQKETLGHLVYDLGNRQWDIPGLRLLLETVLPQKVVFNDFNVEHDFPGIGNRSLLLNARRIPAPPKEAQWILLAFEDVTERMEMERSLQASVKQFHDVFESASDSMLLVDKISGRVLNSNRAAQDSLGYSNQKLLKKNLWELGILKDRRQFRRISLKLEEQGMVGLVDTTIPTNKGGNYPADITIMDRSEVIQCNIHGINERKQAEEALRENEQRLTSIYATVGDVIFYLAVEPDGQYRFNSVNPAFYRVTGIPMEQVVGRRVSEIIPEPSLSMVLGYYRQAIQERSIVRWEETSDYPSGRLVGEVSIAPVFDEGGNCTHLVGAVHDITRRKLAEVRIEKLNRTYLVLSDINQAIVRLHEPEKLYQEACRIAVEQGGFRMAWIGFVDEGTKKVKPAAWAGRVEDYLDKLVVTVRDEARGRGPTGSALREQHFDICNDIEHEARMEPWRADALRLGYRSSAAFPLQVSGKVRGVFTLYASVPDFFDEEEIKLLEELSRDISFAMEFAELDRQRKQAEEKRREDQILLRTLIDNLPDTIFVKDADSRIILDNIAHRRLLGATTLEQVVGKTDFDFFPKEMASSYFDDEKQVVQSGESLIDREEPVVDQERNQRWLLTTKVPLRDPQGKITGIVGINHDITDRKRAEENLRESEAKFRAVVENSYDGILFGDAHAIIHYRSPSYFRINGYTDEERVSHSGFETAHPDDLEYVQRWWAKLIALPDISHRAEYRIRHKDGTWHWIESSGQNLLSNPDVHSVVVTSRDVTARKQAEESLRESEERYRLVQENSMDAILFTAPDGSVLNANQAACEMFGMTEEEIRQSGRNGLVAQEDPRLPVLLEERIRTGKARGELTMLRRDGSKFPVEISSSIFVDKNGDKKTSMIIRDITERKKMEQTLQEYNLRLEEQVEARTRELCQAQEQLVRKERLAVLGELAGSVGHEMRNPLGIISGAIYYLKMVQPEADEKIRQYHEMIEQQTRNAEKIITDLLDFARLSGTEPQAVDVPDLMQRVLQRFPVLPSVKLTLDLPDGLPMILVDPKQMEQVLGNLTLNACQAMPDGGRLTISARPKKGMLAIFVKDTGTGISPENMQKLFEPLFTTKATGIGLGLAVSRKLAEANGGRIEVQSEVDKGSTFTLYVPVEMGKQ